MMWGFTFVALKAMEPQKGEMSAPKRMTIATAFQIPCQCIYFIESRSGSVKKGDEIIMINGQSVINLTLKDVVQRLGNSASPVHFVIATKVSDQRRHNGRVEEEREDENNF